MIYYNNPSLARPNDLFEVIKLILDDISSIQRHGFSNHTDVSKMPVISKFLSVVTDDEFYIDGEKSVESYKWIFNIVILNLYLATLSLKSFVIAEEGKESDLFADLRVLCFHLHDLLEPSIRQSLTKRGISIIQNIICALDTEYQNVSETTNELLSIQFAGHTVSYLRVPVQEPWKFVSVHTLTGKQYPMQNLDMWSQSESGRPVFDYKLVEMYINSLITQIREVQHGAYDTLMLGLSTELKTPGVNGTTRFLNFNKAGYEYFRLAPTQAYQWITLCEEGTNYRLEDQITGVKRIFRKDLDETYEFILKNLPPPKVGENLQTTVRQMI